jgi:hypothetical protein
MIAMIKGSLPSWVRPKCIADRDLGENDLRGWREIKTGIEFSFTKLIRLDEQIKFLSWINRTSFFEAC